MYKEIESSKKWDGLVILIFLIITFTITYPLWNSHQVFVANDWSFHASRVEEIYQNLKSGHLFTYIATHTFQKTGVANFLFYPTIFLYPWAIFRFLFSPVTAFYAWFSLFNLITLLLTYYCAKKATGSPIKAIVAAICYVEMPYHLLVGEGIFGAFLAWTFIPLVMLGGYQLFFTDKMNWQPLAIGLALVSYCHILSVILCIEILSFLFLISLFQGKWKNRERILALLKFIIVCICLTLVIVAPFISDYIGQNIVSTNVGINFPMVTSLENVIFNSFNKYYSQNVGILLILSALTGFATSSNKLYRGAWFIGVILLVVTSTLFPWETIQKLVPILGVIQFPFRYITYAGIFLALVAGDAIGEAVEKKQVNNAKRLSIFIAIAVVAVVYPLSALQNHHWWNNSSLDQITLKAAGTVPGTQSGYKLSNSNYHELFSHGVVYGGEDYYPSQARGNNYADFNLAVEVPKTRSIVDGITYADGKVIKATRISGANKLTYKLKNVKGKTINLPFLVYKNTYLEVGGKPANYQVSKRGTIEFKATSNQVVATVGYKATILMKIGMLVTLISWLAIIASSVLKLRRAS